MSVKALVDCGAMAGPIATNFAALYFLCLALRAHNFVYCGIPTDVFG
jgi:hypothetical protein